MVHPEHPWIDPVMAKIYRFLAVSNHPVARAVRAIRRRIQGVSLPAPRIVIKPMLWMFLGLRSIYYFAMRILVCEPLFKAYCLHYGRRLRTGVFIHWVQGKGDIILGNDVLIDGKCCFSFAVRFVARPALKVGDGSGISHNCRFSVGKQITIGRHCRIASDVWMFDSSGHPADPEARLAGLPPPPEDVRPIIIDDNVWIGGRSIIFPGVTIGEGSVVAAGSVVTGDVPPNTLVAGNPARKVGSLVARPVRNGQPAPA
jgi:acetyltransferase-like isoleucine patch superfamily enzyme